MKTPTPEKLIPGKYWGEYEYRVLFLDLIDAAEHAAQGESKKAGIKMKLIHTALDTGVVAGYMEVAGGSKTQAAAIAGLSVAMLGKKAETATGEHARGAISKEKTLRDISSFAKQLAAKKVPYAVLVQAVEIGAIPGYMRRVKDDIPYAAWHAGMKRQAFVRCLNFLR